MLFRMPSRDWKQLDSERFVALCSYCAIIHHQYDQVREIDDWEKQIEPRGKYYFTRYDNPTPCFSPHLMYTQEPVLPTRIHYSSQLETRRGCLHCSDPRGQSQLARELYKSSTVALKHTCTRFVQYQRKPVLDISKLASRPMAEESGTRGLTVIFLLQDESS